MERLSNETSQAPAVPGWMPGLSYTWFIHVAPIWASSWWSAVNEACQVMEGLQWLHHVICPVRCYSMFSSCAVGQCISDQQDQARGEPCSTPTGWSCSLDVILLKLRHTLQFLRNARFNKFQYITHITHDGCQPAACHDWCCWRSCICQKEECLLWDQQNEPFECCGLVWCWHPSMTNAYAHQIGWWELASVQQCHVAFFWPLPFPSACSLFWAVRSVHLPCMGIVRFIQFRDHHNLYFFPARGVVG